MRLLKALLLAGACVVALVLVLLAVVLQDAPAVKASLLPDAASAQRARGLIAFVKFSLRRSDRTYVLSLSERDLNGVVAFVGRGLKRVSGRVKVDDDAVTLRATLRFPPTPVGRFLNLEFAVLPSTRGLRVGSLGIGPLRIPGRVALPLLVLAADLVVGAEVGDLLTGAVRSVEPQGDQVKVAYRFEGDTVAVVKSRVKTAIRETAPLGDAAVVRVYYERLAQEGEAAGTNWDEPVARYLTPLFAFARERSRNGDPAAENQAAVLALAMYCGTLAFEALIGEVRQGPVKRHWPRCRRNTLGGRHDLMLHFVYSAALKIASDSGLAFAAGEFKELLDSAGGGSGFSFADLAADRAGIRFAEVALDGDGGARRLQEVLADGPPESAYFPDIAGLAEGLDEAAFRRAFGDLAGPAYRAAVKDLDARIARLPAYRAGG